MKVERQVLDTAEELERLKAEVKALTRERNLLLKRHEAQKQTSRDLRREIRELWREVRNQRQGAARVPELRLVWEADRQKRRAKVFLEAVCLLEKEANKREWVTSDEFNALWRSERARVQAIDRERFPAFPACMCVPGRAALLGRR